MNTWLIHKTFMQIFYSWKEGRRLLPGRECAFVLHVIFLPLLKNKQQAGAASTFQEQADGRRTKVESRGMSQFFCRASPLSLFSAKPCGNGTAVRPGSTVSKPAAQTCTSRADRLSDALLSCKAGMRNASFFSCLFIPLTFRAGTSSCTV